MKEYKPTIEELKELEFTTKNTTGPDHYMCILGQGEYKGFTLPEIYTYFSSRNIFIFKNEFEKFKSFEELETRINDLKQKYTIS